MATLYATKGGSSASNLYTVDPLTAATSSIGATGHAITGLAFDPTDGTLYGSTSTHSPSHPASLLTVDPLTGASSLVAAYSGFLFGGETAGDICFDDPGQLYGWGPQSTEMCKVDKATAVTTELGSFVVSGFGGGISVNPIDGKLYLFPQGDSGGGYYTVNTTTGVWTSAGTLTGGPFSDGAAVAAAAFADDGVCWAILNDFPTTHLVTINVGTGAITDVGAMANNFDALAWSLPASSLSASFTVDRSSGSAPLSVVFTDTSTGSPTSWLWDFGDGTATSSEQNPTHVFRDAGAYEVSLTVDDA